MKKILLVYVVFLLLLTGCKQQKGYTGSLENYEYQYESGSARMLEKDIIHLADNCLNNHPFLNNDEMLAYNYYFEETWKNAFDDSKRELFIQEINQIITDFPKLTGDGTEVLYRLQKAMAIIGDAHTQIYLSSKFYFPFVVEYFYEEGKYNLYIVEITSEFEEAMFGQLISINGVSIDEILERFKLYQSSENEFWNIVLSTKDYGEFNVSNQMMLQMTGILNEGDDTADFEILKENGEVETIKLQAISLDEIGKKKMVSQKAEENYTILDSKLQRKKYWYHFDEDLDVMYVRYAECQENSESSLFTMIENVRKESKNSGGVNKLILDLRYNTGGRNIDGDTRLVDLLKDENFSSVYVLINESVFSQGHAIATLLNHEVERAVFVGTPTGEGSETVCCHGNVYFRGANTGVTYRLADRWTQNDPDEEFDALCPDIYIYSTLSDYKAGIDTVLETVINFE